MQNLNEMEFLAAFSAAQWENENLKKQVLDAKRQNKFLVKDLKALSAGRVSLNENLCEDEVNKLLYYGYREKQRTFSRFIVDNIIQINAETSRKRWKVFYAVFVKSIKGDFFVFVSDEQYKRGKLEDVFELEGLEIFHCTSKEKRKRALMRYFNMKIDCKKKLMFPFHYGWLNGCYYYANDEISVELNELGIQTPYTQNIFPSTVDGLEQFVEYIHNISFEEQFSVLLCLCLGIWGIMRLRLAEAGYVAERMFSVKPSLNVRKIARLVYPFMGEHIVPFNASENLVLDSMVVVDAINTSSYFQDKLAGILDLWNSTQIISSVNKGDSISCRINSAIFMICTNTQELLSKTLELPKLEMTDLSQGMMDMVPRFYKKFVDWMNCNQESIREKIEDFDEPHSTVYPNVERCMLKCYEMLTDFMGQKWSSVLSVSYDDFHVKIANWLCKSETMPQNSIDILVNEIRILIMAKQVRFTFPEKYNKEENTQHLFVVSRDLKYIYILQEELLKLASGCIGDISKGKLKTALLEEGLIECEEDRFGSEIRCGIEKKRIRMVKFFAEKLANQNQILDCIIGKPIRNVKILMLGKSNEIDVKYPFCEYLDNEHILMLGKSGTGKSTLKDSLIWQWVYKHGSISIEIDFSDSSVSRLVENHSDVVDLSKSDIFSLTARECRASNVLENEESYCTRISYILSKHCKFTNKQQNVLYMSCREHLKMYPSENIKVLNLVNILSDYDEDCSQRIIYRIIRFMNCPALNSDASGWSGLFSGGSRDVVFSLAEFVDEDRELIAHLLLASLKQFLVAQGPSDRAFHLTIDECKRLDFSEHSAMDFFLTEGRKYGVGLCLATQSLCVLDAKVRAKLTQAALICNFSPAQSDLLRIAKLIATGTKECEELQYELSNLERGQMIATGRFLNSFSEVGIHMNLKVNVEMYKPSFCPEVESEGEFFLECQDNE